MARARLADVYEYSFLNFGERQADTYLDDFYAAFSRIADVPELGRRFHEYRRYDHQAYAIFYEMDETGIVITQIYHHSENIEAKLF